MLKVMGSKNGKLSRKSEILQKDVGNLGSNFDYKRSSSGELNFRNKVTSENHVALISPVSEEIKKAMFTINEDKSPGPDGYNASFYQKNYIVIGPDVGSAALSFSENGYMLRDVKAIVLTLLTKTNYTQIMKEYRPIAYCNVIYKYITKVLACRLQPIPPPFINKLMQLLLKAEQ